MSLFSDLPLQLSPRLAVRRGGACKIFTLWSKVLERVTFDPFNGCWLCHWSADGWGYPQVWDGVRLVKAHVVSFHLNHGRPGAGLFVLHRCDVRRCCNPAHLFSGTQADNVSDAAAKGRMAHGERHYRAKLDVAAVSFIRSSDELEAALARRFGVSQAAISLVQRGRTWGRVPSVNSREVSDACSGS